MKKLYFLLLFLCISFASIGQIINIPDANFKNTLVNTNCAYLQDQPASTDVDSNNDGEIEISEAAAVVGLNIENRSIANVDGMAYFVNLYNLSCGNNQLTSIDISGLHQLNYFSCPHNLFTEINLCGTAVQWFDCSYNPNLTYVSIKNNAISIILGGRSTSAEPPLNQLEFYNCPLLTMICYDPDEFHAVQQSTEFLPITLVTDCALDCLLSSEHFTAANTFVLTPNPVTTFLNLESTGMASINSINIYSVLGQKVQSVSIQGFEKSSSIDVSSLKTGTYFIEIISNQGKSTKKFVKL